MVALIRRRPLATLFVAWLLLLLPFAHGYVENADAEVTLHAARAFWLRGDFGLDATQPDASPAEQTVAGIIASGGSYGMTGRNGRQYVWFPIGHQILLVPCAALGDWLTQLMPGPERALVALRGELRGQFFWARFAASLLPILAAAGAATVLFALSRALGCGHRDALATMLLCVVATQLLPQAPMTTSDLPGAFALLLAGLAGVRYWNGAGGRGMLLLLGVSGGWAVLIRYPHAVPVALLGSWACWVAWRRRDFAGIATLLAGAVPHLLLLVGANVLRFGDPLTTGYSRGANAGSSFPIWLGVPLLLLSPGKGLLWFSPPLWLLAVRSVRRQLRVAPAAVAMAGLLLVLLLHGGTQYWGGGQCYGVRYLTGPAILFLVVILGLSRPWQSHPRLTGVLAAAGLLVAAGGVLAPYRGQQELAFAAVGAAYPDSPPELRQDQANVDPRFSPLHSHWLYAGLSAAGRLDPGSEADPSRVLFGVAVPGQPKPSQPEDIRFRHWWPFYLGFLLGFPGWLLALPLWALGSAAAWLWLRSSRDREDADTSGRSATPACLPPS